MSGDSDVVIVTADIIGVIPESDEENNSLENTFADISCGCVTLSGELDEGYVSIGVPAALDLDLEKGEINSVEGLVEIDSNIPWQLNVEDEKADDKGHMVSTEDDVLQDSMVVNHDGTSVDLSTPGGGTLATGAGPESVDVEFTQEVKYTDAAGIYEIIITFTVFGTF
jgi:hypothetical protein